MSCKSQSSRRRVRHRGVSMLELVIAGSMLAGVMTGLSFVMRTARQSWETIDTEYAALHQMQAVARHFVRTAREANGVSAIAPDGSGITLSMPNGESSGWQWNSRLNGRSNVVIHRNSITPAGTILAENIDRIRFTGFRADGVTPTATPDETHVILVSVAVTLPRSSVPQRTAESKVWIRSW